MSTSVSWAKAFFAIVWKACSTLIPSFALVSKYGMLFLLWAHCWARFIGTWQQQNVIFKSMFNRISKNCWFFLNVRLGFPSLLCFQQEQKGNCQDHEGRLEWGTRHARNQGIWKCWGQRRQKRGRNNLPLGRRQLLMTGIFLDPLCPRSTKNHHLYNCFAILWIIYFQF